MTAGNASGINDGAAALLVMSGAELPRAGIPPDGPHRRLGGGRRGPGLHGRRPDPGHAQGARSCAGLTIDDLDLIELNEAFASQVLVCIRELGLDPAKVNVNGGAIALGHPLGCSGARLMTTLVHELMRRERPLRPGHDVHRRRPGHRHRCGVRVKSRCQRIIATD